MDAVQPSVAATETIASGAASTWAAAASRARSTKASARPARSTAEQKTLRRRHSREAGVRLRSRAFRVSADGVGAATTADEPRQQDGPGELDRVSCSVARSDFRRSGRDSNLARHLSPHVEAIPRCFEAQVAGHPRGAGTRPRRSAVAHVRASDPFTSTRPEPRVDTYVRHDSGARRVRRGRPEPHDQQ